MDYLNKLSFNRKPSTVMHIDLNSCFATIEQQANPLLRGKPIAVAAYTTPSGCILAPSIEAKRVGVKVGMRVKEGKLLCPDLVVLSPDPWKYRAIHLKLRQLLLNYTNDLVPKSIDEFVLNLEGYPAMSKGLVTIGKEIKQLIKTEIGSWITVSIGIGPNRFLAKMASNLKKPDGLEEINYSNYRHVYKNLSLIDLCGIDKNNAVRLNSVGIYTVVDFYNSPLQMLKGAFKSVNGLYWCLRLRGWEIDDVEFERKSFSNMYSLPKPLASIDELSPIIHKLVEKVGYRLRNAGYQAGNVHVSVLYKDFTFWHKGVAISQPIFDSQEIFKIAKKLIMKSPYNKCVANVAVSCFALSKATHLQLDLFNNLTKQTNLTKAVDSINEKWGNFVIIPAAMIGTSDMVPDRIGFGNIKDLEQFIVG